MLQLKTALLALIRVLIVAGVFYLLGLWLGKPSETIAVAMGVFLFWHIFSGRWLTQQIIEDNNIDQHKESFSFLPLTYEDIRLQDYIKKHR